MGDIGTIERYMVEIFLVSFKNGIAVLAALELPLQLPEEWHGGGNDIFHFSDI